MNPAVARSLVKSTALHCFSPSSRPDLEIALVHPWVHLFISFFGHMDSKWWHNLKYGTQRWLGRSWLSFISRATSSVASLYVRAVNEYLTPGRAIQWLNIWPFSPQIIRLIWVLFITPLLLGNRRCGKMAVKIPADAKAAAGTDWMNPSRSQKAELKK